MKQFTLILLALAVALPLVAQKNKKKSRIPSLRQNYARFSVFGYENDTYIHQETNDVWMETFIELAPKSRTVVLPGLGERQSCSYENDSCEFFEDEEANLQLIIIPMECGLPGNEKENRVLRIHIVQSSRKIAYLYSLGYVDAKDFVMFHNYTDQELGQLLTKEEIRFE